MSLSISASELREDSPRLRYINQEYSIAIREIDRRIKNAASVEECQIIYEPKLIYAAYDMSNKDCQALIFSKIIKELEDNQFDIMLEGSGDDLQFIISWKLDCSLSEIDKCKKILVSRHTKILQAHLLCNQRKNQRMHQINNSRQNKIKLVF